MQPWERDGDAQRCTRHGETFSLTGACSKCPADPPILAIDSSDEPVVPPKGCKSTVELERRMTARLATIDALLERLHAQLAPAPTKARGKKPRRAPAVDLKTANTIAKLEDVLLKRERLLLDVARVREDEEFVRRMRRERARLHGATN